MRWNQFDESHEGYSRRSELESCNGSPGWCRNLYHLLLLILGMIGVYPTSHFPFCGLFYVFVYAGNLSLVSVRASKASLCVPACRKWFYGGEDIPPSIEQAGSGAGRW